MSELKPILETPSELETVLVGLRHLPNDTLTKLLLAHYTVDLDVLGEFLRTLRSNATVDPAQADDLSPAESASARHSAAA